MTTQSAPLLIRAYQGEWTHAQTRVQPPPEIQSECISSNPGSSIRGQTRRQRLPVSRQLSTASAFAHRCCRCRCSYSASGDDNNIKIPMAASESSKCGWATRCTTDSGASSTPAFPSSDTNRFRPVPSQRIPQIPRRARRIQLSPLPLRMKRARLPGLPPPRQFMTPNDTRRLCGGRVLGFLLVQVAISQEEPSPLRTLRLGSRRLHSRRPLRCGGRLTALRPAFFDRRPPERYWFADVSPTGV